MLTRGKKNSGNGNVTSQTERTLNVKRAGKKSNKENQQPQQNPIETGTGEIKRLLIEMQHAFKNMKEEMLINEWVTTSRLEALEQMMEQLALDLDELVTSVDIRNSNENVRKRSLLAANAIFFCLINAFFFYRI